MRRDLFLFLAGESVIMPNLEYAEYELVEECYKCLLCNKIWPEQTCYNPLDHPGIGAWSERQCSHSLTFGFVREIANG
jgi:hypothetical protein